MIFVMGSLVSPVHDLSNEIKYLYPPASDLFPLGFLLLLDCQAGCAGQRGTHQNSVCSMVLKSNCSQHQMQRQ